MSHQFTLSLPRSAPADALRERLAEAVERANAAAGPERVEAFKEVVALRQQVAAAEGRPA